LPALVGIRIPEWAFGGENSQWLFESDVPMTINRQSWTRGVAERDRVPPSQPFDSLYSLMAFGREDKERRMSWANIMSRKTLFLCIRGVRTAKNGSLQGRKPFAE